MAQSIPIGAQQRRACWLLLMCLALPHGHPARARYVSPLAASLAGNRRPELRARATRPGARSLRDFDWGGN